MLEYRTLDPLQVRIDTHLRHSERTDDVDATVIEAAGFTATTDLLDVGCGTGAFLRRLAAGPHARLAGLDASPAAVAALERAGGVTVTLGDATALPFPDGSFDAVTARHMLYHVTDPGAAIREARRVLRPGGTFTAVVNITGAYPLLSALVAESVAAHGFDPGVYTVPVTGDNLPGLVAAVFPHSRTDRRDNAFVFDRPEPVAAYAVSMLTGYGVADTDPLRPAVVATVEAGARRLFAGGGPVRDPKGYVVVTGW